MTETQTEPELRRQEVFEKQFEDRYGRRTEIHQGVVIGEDRLIQSVTIQIKHDEKTYRVVEYLTKDQRTDYVLSGEENRLRKYNDYLSAEVYIADLIGKRIREKSGGNTK